MLLRFVPVDAKSVKTAEFSDAIFCSKFRPDLSAGFVFLLADNHENANVLPYLCVKYKRVARSLLAAELFPTVHAFDFAGPLRTTIDDLFDCIVTLVLYNDFKIPFDRVGGLNAMSKGTSLIYLTLLRQSHELRKLSEIIWISRAQKPADAMKKLNASDD